MQLKDKITFAYGDNLTAAATTGADSETARVVETHGEEVDNVETKK